MSPKRQHTVRYDGQQAANYERVIRFITENYLSMDEDWVSHLVDSHETIMSEGIEKGFKAATVGEQIAAEEGLEPLPEDYDSEEQAAPEEVDVEDAIVDKLEDGEDEG